MYTMLIKSNEATDVGVKIILDLPAHEGGLFASEIINDVLLFLSRHHEDAFSVTELADAINRSRPAVTKAVDTLSENDLVVEQREGTRRMIGINRERLSVPDDPYLHIPQGEFHAPTKAATETIVERLDGVLAVVLYGSVVRGEADRRSDIDLWVLVETDRSENQRRANEIREELEEKTFDGSRYEFDIDVEALPAVPNYASDIREIIQTGLTTHETEKFETVQNMVLHGELDE